MDSIAELKEVGGSHLYIQDWAPKYVMISRVFSFTHPFSSESEAIQN